MTKLITLKVVNQQRPPSTSQSRQKRGHLFRDASADSCVKISGLITSLPTS